MVRETSFNKRLLKKPIFITILVVVLLILGGACYGVLQWFRIYDFKSPTELLAPLTPEQRQCIEQVTVEDNIVYVELQDDSQFMGVGYTTSDGIYAAMLFLDQQQSCQIEFMDKISELQDPFEHQYEPDFRHVQRVELTGDAPPEIFVWLNRFGAPAKLGNTVFKFYVKQNDSSYEMVYFTATCRDWSSIQFMEVANENRPRVLIVDDIRCAGMQQGKLGTSYQEFFLTNEGHKLLRSWNGGVN